MPVRLKDLNESLEKKYGLTEPTTLNESTELNERFSDDMPDWLKKRMLVTKYSSGGNRGRRDLKLHKGNMDSKNPEKDPHARPTYVSSKGDERSKDQSLFGKMLEKGIDLDNVKIIEGDVPAKSSDPRLKEPNIPIFLMKNGQVYAKGLNDKEEYKDGGYKAFRYIAMKTLLADCEKFAYIDGADDSNFNVEAKKKSRGLMKQELEKDPYHNRDMKNAGGSRYFPTKGWLQIDKSGFPVFPTVDKYKNELAKIKCDRIHDILKEKEDYINYVKEEMANILMNADVKTDLTNSDSDFGRAFSDGRKFGDAFNYLQLAAKALVEVEYRLDQIFTDGFSEEEQRAQIVRLINDSYEYSNLMVYVAKLEKLAPTLFNSIIDWI